MAKLSSLIGGGGGASVGYETADTQDQVLEANKKYLITSNVTNVRLPDRTGLSAGDTVVVKPSTRLNYRDLTVSGFNLTTDIIVYGLTTVGLGAIDPNARVTLRDRSNDLSHAGNEHVFIFSGRGWEYQENTDVGSGHMSPQETTLFRQMYNESSNFTPANSGNVRVTLVGGGGSGRRGGGETRKTGGGAGAVVWEQEVPVTAGVTYPIVVGAGGLRPNSNGSNGVAGGASRFGGNLLVAGGGGAGWNNSAGGGGSFSSDTVTVNNGYAGQGGVTYNSTYTPNSIVTLKGETHSTGHSGGSSVLPPYGLGGHGANYSANSGTDGIVFVNTEGLYS